MRRNLSDGMVMEPAPDISAAPSAAAVSVGDQLLRMFVNTQMSAAAKITPPAGWTWTQRLQQVADWAQANAGTLALFGAASLILIIAMPQGGRRR